MVPVEGNAKELVSDSDMNSESEMNAALCNVDVVIPTIDDLPPLTIEVIGQELRRDANLTIVHICIENTLVPTSIELEGHPYAIRTNAAMRENLYLRDNLLGLVEEPFT